MPSGALPAGMQPACSTAEWGLPMDDDVGGAKTLAGGGALHGQHALVIIEPWERGRPGQRLPAIRRDWPTVQPVGDHLHSWYGLAGLGPSYQARPVQPGRR